MQDRSQKPIVRGSLKPSCNAACGALLVPLPVNIKKTWHPFLHRGCRAESRKSPSTMKSCMPLQPTSETRTSVLRRRCHSLSRKEAVASNIDVCDKKLDTSIPQRQQDVRAVCICKKNHTKRFWNGFHITSLCDMAWFIGALASLCNLEAQNSQASEETRPQAMVVCSPGMEFSLLSLL